MTQHADAPTTSSAAAPLRAPINVYVTLLVGILAISSSAILIRYAQAEGVPSLLIAAARLILATLALTPFALPRARQHLAKLSRFDLLLAGVSGTFLALHFITWVTSLEYTSVLISVVFVTTSPIWVALLEVFFLRTPLSRKVITGLMVTVTGGLLIGLAEPLSGSGNLAARFSNVNTLIGSALSLSGAVAVAIYIIIGRKLRATLPLLPYIWLVYGCASVVMICITLFSGVAVGGYSPEAYLLLVGIAVFPQLIGHSSLNYAVGYLPATIVSMATQIEPVGAALFAFLLFGEVPLLLQIVGSAIILTGVMAASTARRAKRKQSQGQS